MTRIIRDPSSRTSRTVVTVSPWIQSLMRLHVYPGLHEKRESMSYYRSGILLGLWFDRHELTTSCSSFCWDTHFLSPHFFTCICSYCTDSSHACSGFFFTTPHKMDLPTIDYVYREIPVSYIVTRAVAEN